jgi:3-dehydroquinate synthase
LIIKSKFRDYSVDIVDSLDYIINLSKQKNTYTILDDKIAEYYPLLNTDSSIQINCTENIKTLNGSMQLCSKLIESKCNSYSKLLVIGGGILQDLVGFVASIYSRGIDYVLVPTTLLAMVDSCIGGKTSINLDDRKNILGTFYPPTNIAIYPEFTNSLPILDYLSGLGEVYKFYILQNKIETFDYGLDTKSLIYDSIKYKSKIIMIDEFDKNERKFLNFGHTFGHAIESLSNYSVPHGIAVIIGSMIAAKVSINLGYEVEKIDLILNKGKELIKKTNLLFRKDWFDVEKLLKFAKSDKKNNGNLNMILLNKSNPCLVNINNYNSIYKAIEETYETF